MYFTCAPPLPMLAALSAPQGLHFRRIVYVRVFMLSGFVFF